MSKDNFNPDSSEKSIKKGDYVLHNLPFYLVESDKKPEPKPVISSIQRMEETSYADIPLGYCYGVTKSPLAKV